MTRAGNLAVGFGHEQEMEPSDGALWVRSRVGDGDAFGLLFERHGKAIYNYCFRRLGDWAAAEDALSIVFLEAWRRRDQELADDKVLPWLFGIATNVLRNRRRSQRRFAAALRRMPKPEAEPDFAGRSDQRVIDEQQMRRVLTRLVQLPQHEQEVFVICAWMGLSYEDAALALAVPVGTVRSRLSRARRHLRELDPTFGHEGDGNAAVLEVLER